VSGELKIRDLSPAEELLLLHPAPWSIGNRWPLPQSGSAAFEVLDAHGYCVQPLAFDGLVFAQGIVALVNLWAGEFEQKETKETKPTVPSLPSFASVDDPEVFAESLRRAAGEVH
jgi:hypothetical protein